MISDRFDQPYPLLRYFVRYILPGLILLLPVSAALTVFGARLLAEGVYLEQATRRAQVIDRAMTEAAPDAWHRRNRLTVRRWHEGLAAKSMSRRTGT